MTEEARVISEKAKAWLGQLTGEQYAEETKKALQWCAENKKYPPRMVIEELMHRHGTTKAQELSRIALFLWARVKDEK